jgi:hypothetical protein
MNRYKHDLMEFVQPIAKNAIDELRTMLITSNEPETRLTAAKLILQFALTCSKSEHKTVKTVRKLEVTDDNKEENNG